jgi:putative redox protein
MAVEINAVYKGDLLCDATHGPSGKTMTTEAPADNGGKGEYFSPTDLMATALGTCILTVMGIVARKNGLEYAGAQAHVEKEMTAVPVRRIGSMNVKITIPGARKLPPAARTQLEQAAAVCPVKQSLHPDVKVTVSFVYQD